MLNIRRTIHMLTIDKQQRQNFFKISYRSKVPADNLTSFLIKTRNFQGTPWWVQKGVPPCFQLIFNILFLKFTGLPRSPSVIYSRSAKAKIRLQHSLTFLQCVHGQIKHKHFLTSFIFILHCHRHSHTVRFASLEIFSVFATVNCFPEARFRPLTDYASCILFYISSFEAVAVTVPGNCKLQLSRMITVV